MCASDSRLYSAEYMQAKIAYRGMPAKIAEGSMHASDNRLAQDARQRKSLNVGACQRKSLSAVCMPATIAAVQDACQRTSLSVVSASEIA